MGMYRWQGMDRLLTGSDHQDSVITMLRLRDYSLDKQLRGHSAAIVGMQQMDSYVVSASYDQSVILWSAETGE